MTQQIIKTSTGTEFLVTKETANYVAFTPYGSAKTEEFINDVQDLHDQGYRLVQIILPTEAHPKATVICEKMRP